MSFFSEMITQMRNPQKRLNAAPNRIQPVTQSTANSWGPAPTGYYPDFNQETMGQASNDYPVHEPNGSPGGPIVPTTAVNAEKVDQHVFTQVSGTWTPMTHAQGNGRPTGKHDPQTDGPGQPEQRLLSTWYYRGSGNQRNSYMDVPDGRTFPATGSQDGASTTWYQSIQAAMAPYNIDPAAYSNTDPYGSTAMPDTLSSIPSGPSHGWSAIPVASGTKLHRLQTAKRVGQQNVGQNRLAQSSYAGQTYSQSTAHVQNPKGHVVSSVTPMSGAPGGIA